MYIHGFRNIITKITFASTVILLLITFWLVLTEGLTYAKDNTVQSPSFSIDSQAVGSEVLQTGTSLSNKQFDQKDVSRVIQYNKTHEQKNLAPILPKSRSLLSVSPTPMLASQSYVQPILFISSDQSESPENVSAINATFQMLKRWYSGALEQNNSGYKFKVANTIIYQAPQQFSYYKCSNHEVSCDNYDGIWGNVQTELEDAGYPLWSPGSSFVVFVKGAGGWAGANCGPSCFINWPAPGPASLDGFAILGDWALDSISGTVNSDCFAELGTACYQDPQRGAVGHELGHTFGLAHAQDQMGSIMYSWWNFPYISLFNDPGNNEKDVLRVESKFFLPQICSLNNQVNQTTIPASVQAKTQFSASFLVTNYGFCHWSAGSTTLNIISDDVWGIRMQQLGQDIYPAQQYTFSLELSSPSLRKRVDSKTYSSWWIMQVAGTSFGSRMGGNIIVTR